MKHFRHKIIWYDTCGDIDIPPSFDEQYFPPPDYIENIELPDEAISFSRKISELRFGSIVSSRIF